MTYPARYDDAVSEGIGTIMLIAIVVIGVAIAAAFLWSQPAAQKVPEFGASISNSSCNITLVHTGGDTVENTTTLLVVDGADQTINFIKQGTTGPWASWGIGETLIYTPAMCIRPPQRVDILYRYGNSASILTTGYFENPLSENFTPRLPPLPVIASFFGTPTSGIVPLTVQFTDLSSGSPFAWNWTFGDGGMSSAQNPSYTYQNANTYSVSLTVSNGTANSTLIRTNYITVNPPPSLIANFSGTPTSGAAPLAVTFTDASTGSPTMWNWTFGDIGAGNTSIVQNPSHTYTKSGRYSVNLTVSNAGGNNSLIKTEYVTVTPTPAWYDCSWAYRKNITIDKSQVSGSLTYFPVLINLASDSDLSARAMSNGYDIVFTASDGVTKIPHEIESYTSSSGALVAWVQVPSVSSSADTTIFMYYGNAASTDQQNKNGVWDSNFVAVHHMTGAAYTDLDDSTSYHNDVTSQISVPTYAQAGQIGNAVSFDGTNDAVEIPDSASLSLTQQVTISAWIRSANTAWGRIVAKSHTSDASPYTRYGLLIDGTSHLRTEVSAGTQIIATGTATVPTYTWTYATAVYNKTYLTVFMNGVATGTPTAYTGDITDNSMPLSIARSGFNNNYYSGRIDEVRVSNTGRSASWILTEYNNQYSPSTFYSVGSEELWTCTGGGTPTPTPTPTATETATPTPTATPQPLAFVQINSKIYSGGTSGSTLTVTLPADSTTGNLMVVSFVVEPSSLTVSSVTDSKGNTYSEAIGGSTYGSDGKLYTYYASNINGGSGAITVTVTLSGASGYDVIWATEYAGVAASDPVDQTSAANGNSAAIASGSKTTTQASELIYGFAASYQGATASSPLTQRSNADGHFIADRIVSSTGSYQVTGTNNPSGMWGCQMVTFKGA